jgi:hypothetical protein
VTPVGTNWVVTTLAGLAGVTGTNNGTGSDALFHSPSGVAVDGAGNVYVADSGNNMIRRRFPANGAPVIVTTGPNSGFHNGQFGFDLAGPAGQSVVIETSTDLLSWLPVWTNTFGAGSLSYTDPQSGSDVNRYYRAHTP